MAEHIDVVVIGAGMAGIGLARHVLHDAPDLSVAVLEGRNATGGTWDLYGYPGLRSDSDLHTYAYEFAPWRARSTIARGGPILSYVREVAADTGVDDVVRLNHRVVSASWSSADQRWTLEVEHGSERLSLTCWWLVAATGYYDYEQGYTPPIPGLDRFAGPVIHPQHWPQDLDHAGKRVVVIGSGATAMTLVPALAGRAALVTMLQRTPTYVVSLASHGAALAALPSILGADRAYALSRWLFLSRQRATYAFCRRSPRLARGLLRRLTAAQLPSGFDMSHFDPPYDPWDQRLCVVPDGDLFSVLKDGSARVVTDRIAEITPGGVRLESGRELEADILVTATGFTLKPLGGIRLVVDGRPVDLPETIAYKGMMLSGVPNLLFFISYTNASWTLKVGPVGEHLTRLLAHLRERGLGSATPVAPDAPMETRPLLGLAAGYVRRAADELPRQGDRAPWLMATDPREDERVLRAGPVTDECLRFERSTS